VDRSVYDQRALWAFWIACGLTALGAVAPLLFGGTSNRIGILYAYVVGAVALGGVAMLFRQGRLVAALLYFIAGLVIVYGILSVISLQLRLAVVGTCPPEPARCGLGLERPLTDAETTSTWLVIGFGIAALVIGYFGLRMVYRLTASASVLPSAPPARRIPPVAPVAPPARETEVAPVPVTPEPAAELDELPSPAEALELPAPTAEEAAEPNVVASPPKTRRRRTPKQTPAAPIPPNPDS
jgi:hypothetical protein